MQDPTSSSDRDLMLALAAGDLACLEVLFRRWQQEAFAFCARLAGRADAEDVMQEGFLRVLRYRTSYRGDAFRPWLLRILRNACLDRLRATGRDRALAARWTAESSRGSESSPADADERLIRLERALAALPLEQREVIVLARWHDLPYDRIADVLACSPGAARVRMHRALEKLREVYTEMEREEHGLPKHA
jgi:RNA polymerase sigma-70 factor (ECF subfamily)